MGKGKNKKKETQTQENQSKSAVSKETDPVPVPEETNVPDDVSNVTDLVPEETDGVSNGSDDVSNQLDPVYKENDDAPNQLQEAQILFSEFEEYLTNNLVHHTQRPKLVELVRADHEKINEAASPEAINNFIILVQGVFESLEELDPIVNKNSTLTIRQNISPFNEKSDDDQDVKTLKAEARELKQNIISFVNVYYCSMYNNTNEIMENILNKGNKIFTQKDKQSLEKDINALKALEKTIESEAIKADLNHINTKLKDISLDDHSNSVSLRDQVIEFNQALIQMETDDLLKHPAIRCINKLKAEVNRVKEDKKLGYNTLKQYLIEPKDIQTEGVPEYIDIQILANRNQRKSGDLYKQKFAELLKHLKDFEDHVLRLNIKGKKTPNESAFLQNFCFAIRDAINNSVYDVWEDKKILEVFVGQCETAIGESNFNQHRMDGFLKLCLDAIRKILKTLLSPFMDTSNKHSPSFFSPDTRRQQWLNIIKADLEGIENQQPSEAKNS